MAESETQAGEADNNSIILLIPLVLAVILIVVAITIIVRCFTSRKKELEKINENVHQHAPVDTQGSSYADSQYHYGDGDKNIFART